MIARGMQLIDINPAGWGNFLRMSSALSPSAPRAVLWHDEGMALRMTLNGQLQNLGAQSVQDARVSASTLHARLGGRARQVVVTNRAGYRRLSDTLNLPPRQGELKCDYQGEALSGCQRTVRRVVRSLPAAFSGPRAAVVRPDD